MSTKTLPKPALSAVKLGNSSGRAPGVTVSSQYQLSRSQPTQEFKSDHHAQILATNIATLRGGLFSDFAVNVGTIRPARFNVHKIIMIISCPYFRREMEDRKNFANNAFTIKEVEPEEFDCVLDYIYLGRATVTISNVERLLAAAHRFQLEDLKRGCIDFLLLSLNADNCLKYWRWAEVNDLTRLKHSCKRLTEEEFYRVTMSPDLIDTPPEIIHEILDDDHLDIHSEVDVCEMLMRWLAMRLNSTVGHQPVKDIDPEPFLKLVRWSGVSEVYVSSKLFNNRQLACSAATNLFLDKLLMFYKVGAPFDGLLTLHRPLTGLEKCILIMGIVTDTTRTPDVIRISMQTREISIKKPVGTVMRREAAACVCLRTNMMYVTGVGTTCDEIWRWEILTGWIKCARMMQERRRHCATFVNDTCMYIIGGYIPPTGSLTTIIEKYDSIKELCVIVGDLNVPCDSSACIAFDNKVYVFGGADPQATPIGSVQIFDCATNTSRLVSNDMPRPAKVLRAVLWDQSVILISNDTCMIFDLMQETWTTRHQFRVHRLHFGCVIEDQKLYVFGGGHNDLMKDGSVKWTFSDEIKFVPVSTVIHDKPAVWQIVGHLPSACLVHAYADVTAAVVARPKQSKVSMKVSKVSTRG